MNGLTDREKERYARQLVLPGWGEKGQLRLKASTAFVAGAGGLGSAVVLYLAAAGVGCIRVCDRDRVELSNLNRQILHTERGIGTRKSASARKAVAHLNRDVQVVPLAVELTPGNARELAAHADILLDCLDNVTSRLVLNRLSVDSSLPLVHAGVRGLGGQLAFLHPPATACLACFLQESTAEEPAARPAALTSSLTLPILGAVAGTLGCLQALEALKYLAGTGENLRNRVIFLDGETMEFREVEITRNPDCRVCGA
jgi:molybdopterin/thiamine biosynthesis adenylyltransferase